MSLPPSLLDQSQTLFYCVRENTGRRSLKFLHQSSLRRRVHCSWCHHVIGCTGNVSDWGVDVRDWIDLGRLDRGRWWEDRLTLAPALGHAGAVDSIGGEAGNLRRPAEVREVNRCHTI